MSIDVDIMSGSNTNVTNCKGWCEHYRKNKDLGVEFCHLDAAPINLGYAKGFCLYLKKLQTQRHLTEGKDNA